MSEKEEKGQKKLWKNAKIACETSRKVKQTVLIVGGGSIPDFIVDGRKSDFCNSWGSQSKLFLT